MVPNGVRYRGAPLYTYPYNYVDYNAHKPRLASQTLSVPQHQSLSVLAREEEGSGDLGPLYVNVWNTIIESVTCKDTIIIHRSHLLDSYFKCYLPSYCCLVEQ